MKRMKLTEDWTATFMGWLIILLIVMQFKPIWPKFKWGDADMLWNKVFAMDNILHVAYVFVFMFVFVLLAGWISGKKPKSLLVGFPVIYILTFMALVIGGNKFLNSWGFETVIFSLLIGLFISNIFDVPEWLRSSLSSELFVKIGLVIMGTNVLFGDVLKSGSLGLLQAIVVILAVWNFCFWLCKRLKVDRDMAAILSSAVSICGVSAAIATAGAVSGDKKKLSYAVSLVMVVAVPRIVIMPLLSHWLGLSETLAGAWIGGTIDTTGAVAATGQIYGEEALKTSAIVKFSQNVLLGVAAFVISVYWAYKGKNEREAGTRPTLKTIWIRFPKFVIGFIISSLIFSFFVDASIVSETKPILKNIQGMWFALAFMSIGLETNFRSLITSENKRSTLAFVGAQIFNIFFTLLVAYIIFG